MRTRLAAPLLAVVLAAAPPLAVRACAQTDTPFEVVPRHAVGQPSHGAAYLTALAGVGLVIASFPLSHAADQRYAEYLNEIDVTKLDERFKATERMDRIASGSLLVGEALIATGVWLRFVHHPRAQGSKVTLALAADRCALSLRF